MTILLSLIVVLVCCLNVQGEEIDHGGENEDDHSDENEVYQSARDICFELSLNYTCICEPKYKFNLDSMNDEEVARVTVKGCHNVRVGLGTLAHSIARQIIIQRSRKVVFYSFAFAAAPLLRSVYLIDVHYFDVKPLGFAGMPYLKTLVLRQVSVKYLDADSFTRVNYIGHLKIQESEFGPINPHAISLQNVTKVEIENSIFELLHNDSFHIRNADSFEIRGTSLEILKSQSISFDSLNHFTIEQSKFIEMESNLFSVHNLKTLTVTGNKFRYLPSDAFTNMVVQDKVVFDSNIVRNAHEDSLTSIIYPASNAEVVFSNNIFGCSCDMDWIWDLNSSGKNESILENNYCGNDQVQPRLHYSFLNTISNTTRMKCTTRSPITSTSLYPIASQSAKLTFDIPLFIIGIHLLIVFRMKWL